MCEIWLWLRVRGQEAGKTCNRLELAVYPYKGETNTYKLGKELSFNKLLKKEEGDFHHHDTFIVLCYQSPLGAIWFDLGCIHKHLWRGGRENSEKFLRPFQVPTNNSNNVQVRPFQLAIILSPLQKIGFIKEWPVFLRQWWGASVVFGIMKLERAKICMLHGTILQVTKVNAMNTHVY